MFRIEYDSSEPDLYTSFEIKYGEHGEYRFLIKIDNDDVRNPEEINTILSSFGLDDMLKDISDKSNQIEIDKFNAEAKAKDLKQDQLIAALLDKVEVDKYKSDKPLSEIKEHINKVFDVTNIDKKLFVKYNEPIAIPFTNEFCDSEYSSNYSFKIKEGGLNVEFIRSAVKPRPSGRGYQAA